ncbi:MAG: Z1 domain-containing protein [Nitrospirae bacterium]|nr:Z1 domain-containing protein [Nitrospirota bacterium]
MPTREAILLEDVIVATLARDGAVPTEVEVQTLADSLRGIPTYAVDDGEFANVLRRIHARLQIDMDTGTAIVEQYQPWLPGRKPEIDPYYWERFDKYLKRQGWPPRVVARMDQVTDDILNLLGNPEADGKWQRRGLVMGEVQSGKTATYTALSCKVADAGYRLVILLTGTMENLRRQTQERLDAGFVGLDSSGWLARERRTSEVGVGEIDRDRMAVVFTSRTRDFNTNLVNQLNLRIRDMAEPILLVVKKNKRILENLENWLRSYNAGHSGVIDTPMLLIDDEADNASVNTNPNTRDPTAINERVRALLRLFTRTSYVGFTATPFANIFIDPDTEDEMRGNDLFPRDFIYALEPPTNYVGPREVFGDDPRLDCLREIDDAESHFPASHRSGYVVDELPCSLYEALRTFVLANAVRDLRGEGPSHRSMLVNVSRFTNVQDQVAELLDQEVRQMQQDIRNYSRLPVDQAMRNRNILLLQETWGREFADAGPDWHAIQSALVDAALPVVVKAVNQRTGTASLDFAAHRHSGLRVVAVGGNSLSRGLTLEGLCVSYFFRNTQMYDTLLQMGRWFGYRDGYGDLCRVWLTDEAVHWYAHIANATDELRDEIRRMRAFDLTPKDFGLKVRSHPDSLLVTARNKMRMATEIERVISVSGEGLETPQLRSDVATILANAKAAAEFLDGLATAGIPHETSPWGNTIWHGVPKTSVASMLRRFLSHPLDFVFQQDFLAAFLENTDEPCLASWDVLLPSGKEEETEFAGVRCRLQRRKVTVNAATRSILVSGRSRRVGSRGIEREGLRTEDVHRIAEEYRVASGGKSIPDSEYRRHRERPLLLIHLIAPTEEGNRVDTGGQPLVALGLSFPRFDDTSVARRVRYDINLVAFRNMFDMEVDDEPEAEDDGI